MLVQNTTARTDDTRGDHEKLWDHGNTFVTSALNSSLGPRETLGTRKALGPRGHLLGLRRNLLGPRKHFLGLRRPFWDFGDPGPLSDSCMTIQGNNIMPLQHGPFSEKGRGRYYIDDIGER